MRVLTMGNPFAIKFLQIFKNTNTGSGKRQKKTEKGKDGRKADRNVHISPVLTDTNSTKAKVKMEEKIQHESNGNCKTDRRSGQDRNS